LNISKSSRSWFWAGHKAW